MLAARFLGSYRAPSSIFHPPRAIHASNNFAASSSMMLRAKGDGKKEKGGGGKADAAGKADAGAAKGATKGDKGKEGGGGDKAAAKPGDAKKDAAKGGGDDKKKGGAPAGGDKAGEAAKKAGEEEEEEEYVEEKKKAENLVLPVWNNGEYVPDIVAFRKTHPHPGTKTDKRAKKYRSAWNPKRKKKGLESFFKDGTVVTPPNGVYPDWLKIALNYRKTQLSSLSIRDKLYWKLKRRQEIKAANGAKAKEA